MIRPARREDARTLAEVQVRAWRWAYADIIGEEAMPSVEDREARWREIDLAGTTVWDQDGAVVGFASVGASPDDDAEPSTGAILALYVDPPAQGAGVGAALLENAVARLRDGGRQAATLWVFAANGHARGFYEARGWRRDGVTGEWLGARTMRYRLELV
jgi:ribosomal protein S18 acetylase RimI-like enzyme